MRSLLDVNVLIALLDQDHTLHASATAWFGAHVKPGWASCPLTQNGCVRVMAHSSYPNSLPVVQLTARLREATGSPHHEFWPDDVSLLDEHAIDATRIHGSRQVTDFYLLALAVRHDGTFVTFDRSIALDAVRGATRRHLAAL
jgi:uncharacterized protein